MSPGLTADRLAATRAQLDALAHALGRVDIEAIETSAQALASLVGDLAASAVVAQSAAADLPDLADVLDVQWHLERCRRLGALPTRVAVQAEATAAYRPDGQPAVAAHRAPRLEVAG